MGIIGSIVGTKGLVRKPHQESLFWTTIVLKLPVLGMLMRKIAVARFTRTLGTLISSGVPILEGLDITAKTSGNAVVERALQKVRKALEEGKSLTEPLKESNVFPGMVTQMIAVGEQTGAMDAMLQKIADFYEEEVDAAVKDLLTALEPVMIVFLGLVVGGVVISMYLPLFSLIGKLADATKGIASNAYLESPAGRQELQPGFFLFYIKYWGEPAGRAWGKCSKVPA